MPEDNPGSYTTVRIPADVNKPDLLLGPWSARQAAILGGTALALWGAWMAIRAWLDPLLFLAPALWYCCCSSPQWSAPSATASAWTDCSSQPYARCSHRAAGSWPPRACGRRRNSCGRCLTDSTRMNPAPLSLPAREVDSAGILDLDKDGASVLAAASTVNFTLRTAAEQEVLLSGFARWLNTLTGPVQIASHTAPSDLTPQIETLRRRGPELPHPLLAAGGRGPRRLPGAARSLPKPADAPRPHRCVMNLTELPGSGCSAGRTTVRRSSPAARWMSPSSTATPQDRHCLPHSTPTTSPPRTARRIPMRTVPPLPGCFPCGAALERSTRGAAAASGAHPACERNWASALQVWRSGRGFFESGTPTLPHSPWPATRPRSPRDGSSRCWRSPRASTCLCTSIRSPRRSPPTDCASSARGWNPAAARARTRGAWTTRRPKPPQPTPAIWPIEWRADKGSCSASGSTSPSTPTPRPNSPRPARP